MDRIEAACAALGRQLPRRALPKDRWHVGGMDQAMARIRELHAHNNRQALERPADSDRDVWPHHRPTAHRRRLMRSFVNGSTPTARGCTGLTPRPRRPKRHGRICNQGRRRRARHVGARLIGTSCRAMLHPTHCLPSSRAARRTARLFRRLTFSDVPRAPRPSRAASGSMPRSCRVWSAAARGSLPKSGPNRARRSVWSISIASAHSSATSALFWATRSSAIAPTPIDTVPNVRGCLDPPLLRQHRPFWIAMRLSSHLSVTPVIQGSPTSRRPSPPRRHSL
ncbi:hypothetical protein pclt_cds_1200 [Pandoravirus celtis]|uniref:Uncharacterized protein n=1 Tax=Pandoravirus celtis TaxID=2568002 RepID=A0A4D6EIU8_9VIRU|nr:hypothetical protein pclt_cds_1200 [Pandoravirus celtis]